MDPVFIDFHIHTSDDPDSLTNNYDLAALHERVAAIAGGANYLISFSDHNTINKSVYLDAISIFPNLLVGAELHIRNYAEADPYHCHILFDLATIDAPSIDDLNSRLDRLYPRKKITNSDDIPSLHSIINTFDDYEFLLLPHGGQNHATFDKSIPDGVEFDKTLERSIYYNQFDGFTARSNTGLERTHRYFSRLGIKDFVNLVTATDNYAPADYPDCKAGRSAAEFVPTWMLAQPTFNGVRLSLSESSRLRYGEKPDTWAEYIRSVRLQNENIDIDASLTPGLNVVIGGSSSGKSLFVDSIYRSIASSLDESTYAQTIYSIHDIDVLNPAGLHPHYIDQNYISRICDPKDAENNIDDISILKNVFPSDRDERQQISGGLSELGSHLSRLVQAVKEIDSLQERLKRIPSLSHLIITDAIQANPLRPLLPDEQLVESISYGKGQYERHSSALTEIHNFLTRNPLIEHDESLTKALQDELRLAFERSQIESDIRAIISRGVTEINDAQEAENREVTTKRQDFESLLDATRQYIRAYRTFRAALDQISKFRIVISTKKVESMGHALYIENEFELTKEKFLEVVNRTLKTGHTISRFEEIRPESLFEQKFKKRDPKIRSYDEFERHVKSSFEGMNKKTYRIETKEGKDFNDLSAGWKTSIILDLILGWTDDSAPLIIDQPEDNLATGYINDGLLRAIKQCKSRKQIIVVSHNATIPMLGDAQNVVVCANDNNFISIRSSALEGSIRGKGVVDLVAQTTDGGKASVRKRVKKYNLKSFRGNDEVGIQ